MYFFLWVAVSALPVVPIVSVVVVVGGVCVHIVNLFVFLLVCAVVPFVVVCGIFCLCEDGAY